MQAQTHSRSPRKWRRFLHKNSVFILIGIFVILVVMLVGLLMYALTSPDFRIRP